MKKKVRWGLVNSLENAHKNVLQLIDDSCIEIYTGANFSALLKEPTIDAIFLPTITDQDVELILSSACTKKQILSTNFAQLSVQKAYELVTYCKENNIFMVDAVYHSLIAALTTKIQEGTVGTIKMIRASFFKTPVQHDVNSKEQPKAGALHTLGWYCINTIHYLVDHDPLIITSMGTVNHDAVDTTTIALLHYPNQVHAVVDCSIELDSLHRYEIFGTNGAITLLIDDDILYSPVHGVKYVNDCILQNRKTEHFESNILSSLKAIDGILQSMKQQSTMSLTKSKKKAYRWGEECGIASLLQRL
ncbi:Gfo/Idh/MocA family protein [Halalkalibacterium ligniniphilum]|uniref:Gfo/Idh/MocA family protein n=1 Tax=Halalkalibacterium ligniniphilum TaxID=1134413 RepID=UPI000346EC1D|nr:Gfo/Idh/MocA family oxidoreductase [Halalkalibacterium ligniniphilum]